MNKLSNKYFNEFEQISQLVEQARYRAFHKVNEELILLYFKVGGIVSVKVKEGTWGESIVDQLAQFINIRHPDLKGFNRRGLYRMKQFYETYTSPDFVTPLVTQLNKPKNEVNNFVTSLVTQISWTHHLLILSKTKTVEEKYFYINVV